MNKILAYGNEIWDKMIFFMQHSVMGKLILWCVRGVNKGIEHSAFVRMLSGEHIYNSAERSLFGRCIRGIFGVFTKLGDKIGNVLVKKSVIMGWMGVFMKEIPYISCNSIGVFCVFCGVLTTIASGQIWMLSIVAVGALLLFVPISLYGMVVNSKIFSCLTGIVDERDFFVGKIRRNRQCVAGGILGILLGAIAIAVGVVPTLVFAVVFVGGVVLLSHPEMGIFACVFFAPFLPTMMLAAMLGVTLMCFIAQLLAGNKKYTFKIDTTGVFIMAFAFILLFFGFTSFDPATSIKIALLECLFISSYFLIIFLVDNKTKIKNLIFVYCTSALFTGFVGIWQYLSGHTNTTWTDTELFEELSLRVYSTFENPNVYGEYLLLCIPMAVVMAFITKRTIMKVFYGGTAVVLLANLAMTYSRGCYLAILLAVAVVIWFGARRLISIGFIGLFALPFVLPQSIINRFTSIANLSDSSTSYRISIWQGTIRMLEDFWPFGVGLGQQAYNTVYPIYGLNAIFAPHAHSLYLQVMSEMGIAGFMIMAAFCLAFLSTTYVAFKKAKGSKTMWFIIAMMAAVIGFLFEGIFEYIWYNYRVFLLFFMTLGIINALCRRVIKEGELTFD